MSRITGIVPLNVLLAAIICAPIASRAQVPIQTPKTVALAAARPIQIVRQLPAPTGTPTLRLATPTDTTALISSGLALTRPQLKLRAPTPPGKQALLIIMENGGIVKNLDPQVQQLFNNTNIPIASCGQFTFQLQVGETIPQLLGQVASQIAGDASCINPFNWKTSTLNLGAWFNDFSNNLLENAVIADHSLINTQTKYDKVVVMQDAQAVPEQVIAVIRALAPDYVIDVHVLTHGAVGLFAGYHANFTDASFFSVLRGDIAAGKALYLRDVYQMNCMGGTLKQAWLDLGAISVNGTQGSNLNSMPQQYFFFLQRWLSQQQGDVDASHGSYEDSKGVSEWAYDLVGMGSVVPASELTVVGSVPNANIVASR